jgi:hypothetical protein
MEPLSQKKRKLYFISLIFVFVVLVPITLLYSSGYRLIDGFKIVKTGGIYVGLVESSAELFLDGKLVKEIGILKNGFFIQDLTPRVYHIIVKKDGYRSWEKVIEVLPQRVSETSAFILPNNIPYIEVSTSSSLYDDVLGIFATSSVNKLDYDEYPSKLATSTRENVEDVKKKGGVVLWREGDSVYASWVDNNNRAPSYFCNDGLCDKEILLNKQKVSFFDFHPQSNELVLFVINGVVLMTEIDPRIPRNEQTLFNAVDVEIRTLGNSIFIKEPFESWYKFFEFKL